MGRVHLTGKLPPRVLERLLARYVGVPDRRVIVGPQTGEDAAAVRVGNRALVVATDPITFAADEIGWYAVTVNANDVAVMGARPRWFQACLLSPPATERRIERIFRQIHEAAEALGVAVIGGHTEITHDLPQPIVVGTMMGEVAPGKLVRSSGARPGDDLVLTKGVAIEGTAIIAREFAAAVTAGRATGKGVRPLNVRGSDPFSAPFSPAKGLPTAVLRRARGFLRDPGISVVRDAQVACRVGCHAMHDPTEGGLEMGAWELAEAAGCGVELDLQAVPVLEEANILCRHLDLDVYRTIASGALLVAVARSRTARLLAAYNRAGIPAAVIGRMTKHARTVISASGRRPLRAVPRDEIARLFD